MSDLTVVDRGGVRTITLDRPDSKNGLTYEVAIAVAQAITGATGANVIILAGANGNFCSGLDLKDAMKRGIKSGPVGAARSGPDGSMTRGLRASMSESFHAVIRALRTCGVPTIAAVDGPAVGFGCDLALACDLRICSERATFGEIFIKRGLMPDGGSTFLLPRIVGLGRALELFYTGDVIDAQEAYRIGLANRVVPQAELASTVDALADRFAAGPPLAFEALKNAVYDGLDQASLSAALEREADGQVELLGSQDFVEGLTAFLQKRPPVFRGR